MNITRATLSDVDETVSCLAAAFAEDPITGFLLRTGSGYRERVMKFFSLLMRARIALDMPVLLARGTEGIQGAAMGYSTLHREWPGDLAKEWDRFEQATDGLTDSIAVYDGMADKGKPAAPHYYLGVIGVDPRMHGRGIGMLLLKSFCSQSASDPLSDGVYLETANASNVGFYERAGFAQTCRGPLGSSTLWCMYLPHGPR